MSEGVVALDQDIILTNYMNVSSVEQFTDVALWMQCQQFAEHAQEKHPNAVVCGLILSIQIETEPISENLFVDVMKLYESQAKGYKQGGAKCIYIKNTTSLGQLRCALLGAKQAALPMILNVYVYDDGELVSGTSTLSALLMAQNMGATAFVIHGESQKSVVRELSELAPYAKIPIFVGMIDAQDEHEMKNDEDILELIGTTYSDACFGVWQEKTIDDETMIEVDVYPNKTTPAECSSHYAYALSSAKEAYLMDEFYEVSTVYSSDDFSVDDFLDIQDLDFDVIQIGLTNKDFAYDFAIHAYMIEKPVCFVSDEVEPLETALLHYKGIALVNSDCEIQPDILENICKKYGAHLTREVLD